MGGCRVCRSICVFGTTNLNELNRVQVALMGAVPSAVAALHASRGIAVVTRSGLAFLQNLTVDPANKVMP